MERMNRTKKDIFVFVGMVVAVLSIAVAVNTAIKSDAFKRKFEKEMAFRLDLEERVTKLRNEKLELANSLKDKELEVKNRRATTELLDKEITNKDTEIQKLQSELRTMTLLKNKLEEDLKEELTEQKL